MSSQTEINDIQEFDSEEDAPFVELNDDARVALALYLKVQSGGKVTKEGTLVPTLNVRQLSRVSEVSERQVSKSFDRLRNKGFLANNDNGQLLIPDLIEFETWLKGEGAAID